MLKKKIIIVIKDASNVLKFELREDGTNPRKGCMGLHDHFSFPIGL